MSLNVMLYKKNVLVFDSNITHNLNKMANAAGIYDVLWCPNDNGQVKAKDLILPLSKGLNEMLKNPDFYKKYDSPNGWGLYDNFVPWIAEYLTACIQYPNAIVEIYK